MQIKRIIPEQWYQTKQGVGKCLIAGSKCVFDIDGKRVWLSSTEVQHEIAKGEEPQPSQDDQEERPRSKAQANAETLTLPKHQPQAHEGNDKPETTPPASSGFEALRAELEKRVCNDIRILETLWKHADASQRVPLSEASVLLERAGQKIAKAKKGTS